LKFHLPFLGRNLIISENFDYDKGCSYLSKRV
jgi:hypothetical protein